MSVAQIVDSNARQAGARRNSLPRLLEIGARAISALPLALPGKPSIAVLPFENISGDPEQEYFADGMVEDIITALSRSKSPDTTATRPAKTPPDQTSIPNASPPATTTQTTGQTNQDPTVKEMNAKEKARSSA